MTEEPNGAGSSGTGSKGSGTGGAAFFRDRRGPVRRAVTNRRARNAWTGAVALAMTGGVLVSASASVPTSYPLSDGATASAAQPARVLAHPAAASGPASPGAGAGVAAADGVTVSQVLAVLDRAELTLRQSSSPSPGIAQAAAELGMLWTTYQAQQLALAEAERPLRVESAPTAGEATASDPADEAVDAVVDAAPVSRTVTAALRQSPAPDWDRPDDAPLPRTASRDVEAVPESADGYVTFDEVAVAAMRLANVLDPSSPTALIDALPSTGPSLRQNLLETVAAYGGSTAGYANGRIPADVLCPLPFAPGHLLRCDAAERLTALSERFEEEFGYPIPLTDSYRSYAMQVAVKGTKPHLAAFPGTSNHGWGLAVDLGDPIAGGSSDEYVWLRLHAPDYGWDNPSWAQLGGAKPEPWHFEFFAAGSIPNRAIDPADVGTWAESVGADAAARPAGKSSSAAHPASDGSAGSGSKGSGSGGSGAGSGGSSGGSGSSAPSDTTPTKPEQPAPSEPEPSEPPVEEEPEAPAGSGLVEDVVGGTVGLVGDTVEGVVGGVVGGLLGGSSTNGATNQGG
ncbi:D-alanyl-D-alanine carboxypeptidase family protein [Promicromonospora sukumoe]|uniref:D-alanyl-D-alanine carboxypeptidase family protein n=1 Tax=Promicromonospora sukumoe TaxID=88382 RepID=UPI0036477006